MTLQNQCPDEAELEALLHDAQAPDEVESHVEACGRCRYVVEQMRENDSFLRSYVAKTWAADLVQSFPEVATIDGYEILAEIHRGGQGIVYKAIQTQTKRIVAVKVLLRGILATGMQRHRFEREIAIAASLHHPNIVTLYERTDLADQRMAFSMEYVQGLPIDAWAREHLSPAKCGGVNASLRQKLRLFIKVCDGIHFAHQRGIIHRDLKPANILVDETGEPRVLDFGLAKEPESASQADLTRASEFLGTMAYSSPEQVDGDPSQLDTRTDVYSLGILLYELLADRHPCSLEGPISEIIAEITEITPAPPSRWNRSIRHDVDTIVLKALAKDRERRYGSAGDLAQDIGRFLQGEPVQARGDSTWYRLRKTAARHRAVTFSVAAFVMVTVVFVLVLADAYRDTRRLLRISNVERGRSYVEVGSIGRAEDVLWGEHLSGDGAVDGVRRARLPGLPSDSHWALWRLYEVSRCVQTIQAHETGMDLEFRPGSRSTVASGGRDGSLKLWDDILAGDIEPQARLLGTHEGGITSISFSSDGRFLASSGSEDGRITILEVDSGEVVRVLPWQVERSHSSLAFSPRENVLAAAVAGGRVLVSGLEGNPAEIPHPDPDQGTEWMGFSADGSALHLVSWKSPHVLWRLPVDGGAVRKLFSGPSIYARYHDLSISADGSLATFRTDPGRFVVNVRTGAKLGPLSGLESLFFTNKGKHLLGVADATEIRVWRSRDPSTEPVVLRGHRGRVADVVLSPGEKHVVSGGIDGSLKVWSIDPNRTAAPLAGFEDKRTETLEDDTVFGIVYSADGQRLLTASQGGRVIVRAPSTGHEVSRLPQVPGGIGALASCPWDSDMIAIGGHEKRPSVVLWNVQSREQVLEMKRPPERWVSGLAYVRHDRTLVASSGEGSVRAWDTVTGAPAHDYLRADIPGRSIHGLEVDPTGRWLAACGRVHAEPDDAHFWVWDVHTRKLVRDACVEHSFTSRDLDFGPDGLLALGTDRGSVYLLRSMTDGQPELLHEGDGDAIFCVAFDAAGETLAVGSQGGVLQLWDVSRRALLTTQRPGVWMFSLEFHRDGATLFTGSTESAPAEKRLLRWDLLSWDRAIAGNAKDQINRIRERGGSLENAEALLLWAEGVFER